MLVTVSELQHWGDSIQGDRREVLAYQLEMLGNRLIASNEMASGYLLIKTSRQLKRDAIIIPFLTKHIRSWNCLLGDVQSQQAWAYLQTITYDIAKDIAKYCGIDIFTVEP